MERKLSKLEGILSSDKEELLEVVADLIVDATGSPVVDHLTEVLDRMDSTFRKVCWYFWILIRKYQKKERDGPLGAPPEPRPAAVPALPEGAKEKRMVPAGPSISPLALAEGSWKEVVGRKVRMSKGKGISPPVQLPQSSAGGRKRKKRKNIEGGGGLELSEWIRPPPGRDTFGSGFPSLK